MTARIKAIEYYLPDTVLDNAQLAEHFGDWSSEKILEKTGIAQRHIAAEGQCSSDLAFEAAQQLFASQAVDRSEVDFVLLCTQSPDYFLPTTACVLQERLGIPTGTGALDFNLGCSGYVYGLGLAKGLIETGQARNVLFLTGETYSKYIHPDDRSVRTLFGDAGSATLVQADDASSAIESIGPFVYGTDGNGANNLIVPSGALRQSGAEDKAIKDTFDNCRGPRNLYMNGAEIFTFTLRMVPLAVLAVMKKANLSMEDIDLFVFHQANEFMLKHLRAKIGIPEAKFVISMGDVGNTVSSSIPIALKNCIDAGRIKEGSVILLIGFGVGYSWGATILHW